MQSDSFVGPDILKRCQEVIQQLNHQLNKKVKIIEALSSQKHYLVLQCKQNKEYVAELINQNSMLKDQLDRQNMKIKQNNSINEYKNQLSIKSNEIEINKKYIKELENKLILQQQNYKKNDEEWNALFIQLNHQIKCYQNQTLEKQSQIQHLQNIIKRQRIQYNVANNSKTYGNENNPQDTPIGKNRKNNEQNIISVEPLITQRKIKKNKDINIYHKIGENSQTKINNAVYMNQREDFQIKRDFSSNKIKSYTYSQIKNQNSQTKSPFIIENLQKDINLTQTNLKKQYQQFNQTPRLDRKKVQRTLNELQIKLSKMIKKIEVSQSESCMQ